MNKILIWVRQVPGWLLVLVLFGGLYLTGLHTEVIGQAQRLLLATGFIKPQLPAVPGPAKSKQTRTALSSRAPETVFPPADFNFNLKTLRGESVTLESLKGKVVFMNFWATWCPPCVAEMPNIQSLYEKMPADKIAFVMVSMDEDPAKAQKFVARKGFAFPVYTPDGPIPQAYAGQVIPTTFVISPDGRVMTRQQGMADYDNARFRDFLLHLAQDGEAGKL
jgi:thiol-disulfide isomerase/thioredoxin